MIMNANIPRSPPAGPYFMPLVSCLCGPTSVSHTIIRATLKEGPSTGLRAAWARSILDSRVMMIPHAACVDCEVLVAPTSEIITTVRHLTWPQGPDSPEQMPNARRTNNRNWQSAMSVTLLQHENTSRKHKRRLLRSKQN